MKHLWEWDAAPTWLIHWQGVAVGKPRQPCTVIRTSQVICTKCELFSLAAFVPLGGNFPWKKFRSDDSDLEFWSQLIHFCSSCARGSWGILSSPNSVDFLPGLWACSNPYRLPGGEGELGMFSTSTAFQET